MRNLFRTTAITLMLAITPAFAGSDAPEQFVLKASMGDMFEIESSKIALNRSRNAEVRSFAQQMIDDHSKSSANMKNTLKSANLGYKTADKLDNEHVAKLNTLQSAPGDQFDANYISMQNQAHEEAVSLFTDYSKLGNDASLRKFASDTLPTLKMHKDHVAKLSAK